MIIELGHFALILALAVALAQTALPLWGARVGDARLMGVAEPAALAQLTLLTFSFLALMHAYVTSDFSVEAVWANSHTAKPLIYKIAGVWGNHEGSHLLWVLILALFGAAVALFGEQSARHPTRPCAGGAGRTIGVAFLVSFIVLTSNPFCGWSPAPAQRPRSTTRCCRTPHSPSPALPLPGYVGLSIAFSFAVAALIEGRADAAWARWVRPWTLAAWVFLTLGIAIGSWWAYYELGWGGCWFWDPVENASFMPWLAAAALLHSALVVEKREALKSWTILLAILAFGFSLIGTFIVRFGVLTSVHAFANDPERGAFILTILSVSMGGALTPTPGGAPARGGRPVCAGQPRGSAGANNVLLTTACATVFVGTLYPLALEFLTGAKISVGPPYFNLTFGPLMLPLLAAMPFGPYLAWKRGYLYGAAQRLFAAGAPLRSWRWSSPSPVLARATAVLFGVALGVWIVAGAISEWVSRVKLFAAGTDEIWRRARGLPRSAYGTTLAHAGIGLSVLGIVATSAWQSESVVTMRAGDATEIAGYVLTFRGVAPAQGPNYQEQVGLLTVTRGGAPVTELRPAKRLYDAPRMPTTEAAIHVVPAGDLYVVLGDELKDGAGWVVRLYFNPLVRLIWIGAISMGVGGALRSPTVEVDACSTSAAISASPSRGRTARHE